MNQFLERVNPNEFSDEEEMIGAIKNPRNQITNAQWNHLPTVIASTYRSEIFKTFQENGRAVTNLRFEINLLKIFILSWKIKIQNWTINKSSNQKLDIQLSKNCKNSVKLIMLSIYTYKIRLQFFGLKPTRENHPS